MLKFYQPVRQFGKGDDLKSPPHLILTASVFDYEFGVDFTLNPTNSQLNYNMRHSHQHKNLINTENGTLQRANWMRLAGLRAEGATFPILANVSIIFKRPPLVLLDYIKRRFH